MNIFQKLSKFIFNPKYRFCILSSYGFFNGLSDEKFLKKYFKIKFGYKLNLDNPQTFSEKLQWLKLYNRNPLYTTIVDKYAVKKYIADKIGDEYIIPTFGVWNKFEEIDFDKLPNQFVLKTTHDSKNVVICKDKNTFDKQLAREKITKSIQTNYYYLYREWPYKNVPRKIIAEQYMEDKDTKELRDYKFFCFDGYVDNVMVCINRNMGNPKFYFFNDKWELLRINKAGLTAPKDFTLEKPILINEMFKIASILSKNIPFVRVDLYNCNNKIYFGEMTFYPTAGFDSNILPETDKNRGLLLKLPK